MSPVSPTLAETLTTLIHDQRLSYAHIARVGHLSRNTVKQIADGKTKQPNAETLCLIAVGLAQDPYTGSIDQETLVMALRRLGRAAGYDDLREDGVMRLLPPLLATITGDLDAARAWADLVVEHAGLDADRVRALGRRRARSRPGDVE